jgi:hypothetical protein
MRNPKGQLIGWALIGFVAVLAVCAGGLIVLKVLPPRDQSRIMLRLPAPVRQAVSNLLFPHPDIVPTPSEPVKNVSLLLTPQATRTALAAYGYLDGAFSCSFDRSVARSRSGQHLRRSLHLKTRS